MLETYCRPSLQALLFNPIAKLIHKAHAITPNHLTLMAGMFGMLSALLLYWHHAWWAVISLLASGLLDVLDGSLARLKTTNSSFGCALDIVTDRVVESSVIIGLYAINPMARSGYCLAMLVSTLLCVTSFLVVGVLSEQQADNKSFYYSPGLIERAEAFIFFIAMMLLPQWFAGLAISYTTLVILTTLIRLYQFKQHSEACHANH